MNPKINQPDLAKWGYIAFSHNGKQAEVWATSSLQARDLAVVYFKSPKSKKHLVHVVLCEKPGGVQVEQTANF